jgi:peroxiredoxin
MELEALQEIDSEVRGLGGHIVTLTPELERYTRALHKKLNLTFDIVTDLHLKTVEEFRLVFTVAGLFAQSLQVLRQRFGQISRRNGLSIAGARPLHY